MRFSLFKILVATVTLLFVGCTTVSPALLLTTKPGCLPKLGIKFEHNPITDAIVQSSIQCSKWSQTGLAPCQVISDIGLSLGSTELHLDPLASSISLTSALDVNCSGK